MFIVPYIRLLLLALFATLIPLVDAKGGGGGKSGGSRGGGGSKGKGKVTKTTVIVGGTKQQQCRDSQTGQIVQCPKDNKATVIAVAVVCSVLGLAIIIFAIYWVRRRNRNKREAAAKTTNVPAMESSKKKEYKPLTDMDKTEESV